MDEQTLRGPVGPRPPVVDGYTVGELLGAGATSTVWSGIGPDGVPRALKVLRPADDEPDHDDEPGPGAGTDPAGTDLLRELGLLRRVRHPRLVSVHDIARDADDRPVLVLDLATGGSLAQLLRTRSRLGVGEVVGLLADLGPALEELHSAGIVHGDLAPGNVLLDAEGRPLLGDLGVARALGRRPGSIFGTPGFTDPAAVATGRCDAASDVFGLAAVGWAALTGRPPTLGSRGLGRGEVRDTLAALPAGTSAALLDVLRDGLQSKPSRRPTPGELALAAEGCARSRPVRLAGAAVPPPVAGPVDPALAAGLHPVPSAAGVHAATRRVAPARTTEATGSAPPEPGRGPRRPARERSGAAEPLRRRDGAHERRRRPRRLVGSLAAAVVLAGLGGGVWLHARSGPTVPVASTTPGAAPSGAAVPSSDPTTPTPPTTPTLTTTTSTSGPDLEPVSAVPGRAVLTGSDLRAVVQELATRRAGALTAADPEQLTAVDVGGSPALLADADLLEQLQRGGQRWEGLGFDVHGVTVEESAPDRAVVQAAVVTTAHEVLEADGSTTEVEVGAPRHSRLTLVRVAGEWRISAVG